MLPWNWTWSAQVHFPLSGSVVQDIQPNLDWFFAGIRPEAGMGGIEQRIFEKASYGKQPDLILDVLLPLVDASNLESEEAKKTLAQLKKLYTKIETVKKDKNKEMEDTAVSLLKKIEETDMEMLGRAMTQFKK